MIPPQFIDNKPLFNNFMDNKYKSKRYNPYGKSTMHEFQMYPNNEMEHNLPKFVSHHQVPSFENHFYSNPSINYSLNNLQIWIDNQNLWNQFSLFGNEMIITKPGRRMFPVLSFTAFGLNPSSYYKMEAEIIPADNNRYKYVSVSGWRINGVASKQDGNKKMYHPDGLQLGDYWQRNGVAFKRIKLTNKKTQKEGSNQIVVNSMHKYEIKLNVTSFNEAQEIIETKDFCFKETQFIAVTAYQNDDVTQLKIDHNPFAKAFRDNNSADNDQIYDAMMYNQSQGGFMKQNQYTTHMYQKSMNDNFMMQLNPNNKKINMEFNQLPTTEIGFNFFNQINNNNINNDNNNNNWYAKDFNKPNFEPIKTQSDLSTIISSGLNSSCISAWDNTSLISNKDINSNISSIDVNNSTPPSEHGESSPQDYHMTLSNFINL